MESFLGWLQQCYTTWMCIWTFEAIDFAFKFIKNPVSKKKYLGSHLSCLICLMIMKISFTTYSFQNYKIASSFCKDYNIREKSWIGELENIL